MLHVDYGVRESFSLWYVDLVYYATFVVLEQNHLNL